MKKVLFVIPHMLCGGVEKALLSLISEMSEKDFKVSILMVKAEGDFMPLIPQRVESSEIVMPESVRNELMLGGIKASAIYYIKNKKIGKLIKLARNIITKNPLATLLYDFDTLPNLEDDYDTAVCFHIHMPFIVRYVAEKVKSKRKIAWIHNDFTKSGYDINKLKPYLSCYDHFCAVSKQLQDEFIQIFPEYREKISIAHNILSEEYIKTNADESYPVEYTKDNHTVKILSIGRLDKQKGFDIAIDSAKKLLDEGHEFIWYILGNGIEEKNLRNQIAANGLQNKLILLGIRNNPYPYIKNCDIYVQPSRHEGYGIAVAEARILHKAIICTDFAGAREQIVSMKNGIIVPVDMEGIATGIRVLIEEPKLRTQFEENLAQMQQTNPEEVREILGVLL